MSTGKCIKPRWRGPLVACLLLVAAIAVGSAGSAHALEATWFGLVSTIVLADPSCTFEVCASDEKLSPPDTPVLDFSVSTSYVSDVTYFSLASLTAFVNVGDVLSVQGVAQADAFRTPTSALRGTTLGESVFQVDFTSSAVPLSVDISGTMHRSGPDWNALPTPGGVEFSLFSPFDQVQLPARPILGEGDFPFEYHAVVPPNRAGRVFVLAAALLPGITPSTTGETRVVWNLQITPVPWPGTSLLMCISLAWMTLWRKRTRQRDGR